MKADTIIVEVGDSSDIGTIYNGIGNIYNMLGNKELANCICGKMSICQILMTHQVTGHWLVYI